MDMQKFYCCVCGKLFEADAKEFPYFCCQACEDEYDDVTGQGDDE